MSTDRSTDRSTEQPNPGQAHLQPHEEWHPSPADHVSVAVVKADDRVPAVHIWRDVHATPQQVMRAHTDPELFARWIGPHDLTTEIDVWECRTLGSYRYVQRRGEESYAFRGTFPYVGDDRIVQTFCYEEWPQAIALETMTFTAMGDGRTRIHGVSLCDSFESRDAFLASGMETGVNEGYEKLDRLLSDGGTH
ncbi:SRPBCC domain-containing protein [Nocardioides daphniae]|uniref:Activator of HSP90 ATPase n=1 Tax=Nocardioides daphniae TaxID=402297 RepID=A0A4P7UD50_9ACTN|nr:SRPBCC domain-containing protein [Nocardioides daphniae]QCC77986.1 polyketide cyclase [Nocardioides daphniae]GGD23296.1 activator of HSP90 ATPase [Nocardioides daphniae]